MKHANRLLAAVVGGLSVPKRQVISALAAILLLLVPTREVAAVVPYRLTDLGTLGGSSVGTDLNDHGQVTGFADTLSDDEHGFIYSEGVMRDLGTLGGDESYGYAVNNLGQVVGYSRPESGAVQAFLYSDGQMIKLASVYSRAYDINDHGQITGEIMVSGGRKHAFLYDNGAMTDLGTLGGSSSLGYGMNSNGEVTGYSYLAGSGDSRRHAFVYANGVMTDLGTLSGPRSHGADINDRGEITGTADKLVGGDSFGSHAFLYRNGEMIDLGTLGGSDSSGNGINSLGQITGAAYTSSGRRHAFIYTEDTMFDLNDLIPPHSGWLLGIGSAINDAGQITGTGYRDGQQRAFLLTPIPEPSTLALLVIAGLLTYAYRRRRPQVHGPEARRQRLHPPRTTIRKGGVFFLGAF